MLNALASVALVTSGVAADADTSTTPVSVASPTPPTVPGPTVLRASFGIDPHSGPIGTPVSYEGACGARAGARPALGVVTWGVSFSTAAGPTGGHFAQFGLGAFDAPSGPATFHAEHVVPAELLGPIAVEPGTYYVNGGCIGRWLESCAGCVDLPGFGPVVLLTPQVFCVTRPGTSPSSFAALCLDDGWLGFLWRRVGVGRFLAGMMIELFGASSSGPFVFPPGPPPPTTTTTTPRRTTTTTTAVTTTTEEPTTSTTLCVPPPCFNQKPCPPCA